MTSLEIVGVALTGMATLASSWQQTKGSKELESKNTQIVDLQRKISDKLTGGDSYCYLVIRPDLNNPESGHTYIYIFPPVPNPLYDVAIQYSDTSIAAVHGSQDAERLFEYVKGGWSFNAINMGKHYVSQRFNIIRPIGLSKWRQISVTSLPFVIDARFDALNGRWHQSIILVKGTDGEVARADFVVRVFPRPSNSVSDCQVLYEDISKNFPNPESIFVRLQDGKRVSSGIPFCCIAETDRPAVG